MKRGLPCTTRDVLDINGRCSTQDTCLNVAVMPEVAIGVSPAFPGRVISEGIYATFFMELVTSDPVIGTKT